MASPKRKRSAVVRIAGEKRVANDREKKFAREYLKCFNFYKAAKAAGFAETTARRTAYMIFSRPWVQEYVEELRAKYELDDIAEVKEVIRSYTDQMRGKVKETIEYKKYFLKKNQETGQMEKIYTDGYIMENTLIKAGSENMGKYHKLFRENSLAIALAPTIVADVPAEQPAEESELPTYDDALKAAQNFEDLAKKINDPAKD